MLNNIGYLKQDLIAHKWHMTAFPFTYNKNKFVSSPVPAVKPSELLDRI